MVKRVYVDLVVAVDKDALIVPVMADVEQALAEQIEAAVSGIPGIVRIINTEVYDE